MLWYVLLVSHPYPASFPSPSHGRSGLPATAALYLNVTQFADTAPTTQVPAAGAKSFFSQSALWSLLPKNNLDRPAVVSVQDGEEVSYRELQEQSLSFAGRLRSDLGYQPGDRLALVLGGNYLESVVAQLGAAAAGVTVVTAASVEDNALAGCRGMVVSANVLQDRPPQGILDGEKHPPIVTHDDFGVGSASVALFWQGVIDCRPLDASMIAADPSLLHAVYGGAKATDRNVTQGDIASLARSVAAEMELSEADRAVVAVPLAHSFGFGSGVMATFLTGGTLIIPSVTPDAEQTKEAVESEGATVVLLDRDALKELQQREIDIAAPSLRKGVLKIGSGWALHQEPEKFKEYMGTPLVTIGRGLPKRTSW